jgi:hypothetical protein
VFGAQNRDGWSVGLTIQTALANLLPVLPQEEVYLALFHGAPRVAADCVRRDAVEEQLHATSSYTRWFCCIDKT